MNQDEARILTCSISIDFPADSRETRSRRLLSIITPPAGYRDRVMLPQPISWPDEPEEESSPAAELDLGRLLEQQVAAGFPPGLALDLVLNELVVRAAGATRARSAALALVRGDAMVCRAATGEYAPDLGVPLNTRDGLSGACLRTRQSQLCRDTESDPRVDASAVRQLGIRSMMIVPVLEGDDLVGVLEVFSPSPAAFSESDEHVLEKFARDCSRIRRAATGLDTGTPVEITPFPDSSPPEQASATPAAKAHGPYEGWTLILGSVAILLTIGMSLLIGARFGWLRTASPVAQISGTSAPTSSATNPTAGSPVSGPARSSAPSSPSPGALVVYDQGKVIFRMKPAHPKSGAGAVNSEAGSAIATEPAHVWLAPDAADSRLRHRIEPDYPAEARAAHRSGDVVLEVLVAQNGVVSSIRTVSGDPLLADAAAAAVRQWQYEPYRLRGRPAEFLTEVTLKFSLPE